MNKKAIRERMTPLFPILDIILSPFTLLASLLLFSIRKMRINNMPVSKKIFKSVGVFPISNHYYEPLFDDRQLRFSLDRDRNLPGIDWNVKKQLSILQSFNYQSELSTFPFSQVNDELKFYFGNPSFGPGDAEYLYSMIRLFKPAKVIEIGSGYSTLMCKAAIEKNKAEDPAYTCHVLCIEPYEMPWLEKTGIEIVRKRVEDIDLGLFKDLKENDILFIDSSHIIRPQGDVLFEFLEILPVLPAGVFIHVHDIFSPGDYKQSLVVDEVLFWNEQYLLEAFLSCNDQFEITGALHFLKKHHAELMMTQFPVLNKFPSHEPGSFWFKKRSKNSL
jgi:hypothetical protein